MLVTMSYSKQSILISFISSDTQNNLMKWKEKYYDFNFTDKEAEVQKWRDLARGIVVSKKNITPGFEF